jgi:hypothetical protein
MDTDKGVNRMDEEYAHGEFSGLDDPDYDLERAARDNERARRENPAFGAFLREFERTGRAPARPAPHP